MLGKCKAVFCFLTWFWPEAVVAEAAGRLELGKEWVKLSLITQGQRLGRHVVSFFTCAGTRSRKQKKKKQKATKKEKSFLDSSK